MINSSSADLCLERDAHRCRVCGSTEKINAVRLVDRDGEVAGHLSNLVTLCEDCRNDKDNVPKSSNKVGVILCGGRATRLYPLTMHNNKHILPVGIVPMAFYPIKTLRKFGIRRVLIVIDQFSSSIVQVLGSGKMFGMDFSYKLQNGAFGIADALYLAKDFAKPNDEIVCVLGDNIFDLDELDTNVDLRYDNEYEEYAFKSCVYLKKVTNPEDYGVAVLEHFDKNTKIVTEIVEKPKTFISDMAVVGLYVYTYDVFKVIESIKPSERGELEISSINDHYAKSGQLLYKEVNGYWADCGGSIQRYAEASMHGAKQANVSVDQMKEFVSTVFDDK